MRKIFVIFIFSILLLIILPVSAHEHNFNATKQLIESGTSCDKLTDDQLENIGDYYMEQQHPGKAHEMMDQMMGGEGSDSLKQAHITMAKRLYCNENVSGMMGGSMMGMMMGSNMIGYSGKGIMNSGMMVNGGYGFGYWNFINTLYIIMLIGFIILVYLWILKIWKNMQNKGDKK